MKLPNGYGTVYKLSGNRRKPWIAVKTVGWELKDGKARQKKLIVGYYATKKEGLNALAMTRNLSERCTFAEVYERWSEQAFPKLSTTSHYERAYRQLESLHKRVFAELRTAELESKIMEMEKVGARKNAKILLNQMYQYAIKYDLCNTDYAKRFNVTDEKVKIERVPFTDEEIARLWDDKDGAMILIQIYSGWRSAELVSFTVDGDYMYGGVKTDAGRGRVVPIHPIIKGLIPKRVQGLTASAYIARFNRAMKRLGMSHTSHDCRVTFATKCHMYGVDLLAEQKMMGHKPSNITESIYTKLTKEYLREELLKIK